MFKRCLALAVVGIFALACIPYVCAEEMMKVEKSDTEVIKGVISEIAEDGSYIVVNETKVPTDEDFLADYFQVGDLVEVEIKESAEGMQVVDYDYIVEEMEEITGDAQKVAEEEAISEISESEVMGEQ